MFYPKFNFQFYGCKSQITTSDILRKINSMNLKKLAPVMLCFFAMGFVDLVGIASNYVKADLNLSDSMANTLPSLVFLWFLIFSIPTSLLMNKIGRKNTVLVSLVMTIASLLVPIFTLDFTMLLLSFSLLGIALAGEHFILSIWEWVCWQPCYSSEQESTSKSPLTPPRGRRL